MRKYEWSMETIEWLQADPAELEQADQSQPETQLVLFLDSAGKDERAAEQYWNGIRDFDLSAPIRFFTEQGNDAAAKLLQNWRSRAQKQTSGESTLLRKRWDNWKKDYEGYSEFELEQRIQEGNEFARLALAERRLHSTSLIDKQQGLDELMAVRQHFAEQLSANGEDEKTLRVIISSLSLLMGDWYKRLDGKLAGRDLKQAAYTRYLEAMEMHEYWVDRPVRCCCNGYGTEVSENRALQWLEQALPLFGKRPNRYSADLAMQTAYLFEKKGQLVPAKSRLQWVLQNADAYPDLAVAAEAWLKLLGQQAASVGALMQVIAQKEGPSPWAALILRRAMSYCDREDYTAVEEALERGSREGSFAGDRCWEECKRLRAEKDEWSRDNSLNIYLIRALESETEDEKKAWLLCTEDAWDRESDPNAALAAAYLLAQVKGEGIEQAKAALWQTAKSNAWALLLLYCEDNTNPLEWEKRLSYGVKLGQGYPSDACAEILNARYSEITRAQAEEQKRLKALEEDKVVSRMERGFALYRMGDADAAEQVFAAMPRANDASQHPKELILAKFMEAFSSGLQPDETALKWLRQEAKESAWACLGLGLLPKVPEQERLQTLKKATTLQPKSAAAMCRQEAEKLEAAIQKREDEERAWREANTAEQCMQRAYECFKKPGRPGLGKKLDAVICAWDISERENQYVYLAARFLKQLDSGMVPPKQEETMRLYAQESAWVCLILAEGLESREDKLALLSTGGNCHDSSYAVRACNRWHRDLMQEVQRERNERERAEAARREKERLEKEEKAAERKQQRLKRDSVGAFWILLVFALAALAVYTLLSGKKTLAGWTAALCLIYGFICRNQAKQEGEKFPQAFAFAPKQYTVGIFLTAIFSVLICILL